MHLNIAQEPRFLPAPASDSEHDDHAALVRAAYAFATEGGTPGDFIERLGAAAHASLARGAGVIGCVIAMEGDVCRVERAVLVGCPSGTYEALCSAALAIDAAELRATLFGGAPVGVASERLAPTTEEYLGRRELTHLARAGIVNHVFLRLVVRGGSECRACFLLVPCREVASLRARERAKIEEVATELSAAVRLHQSLTPADPGDEASAGIMRLCRTKPAERAQPERALALWRAMLDGRLRLLAQSNAQGKRLLLVRKGGADSRLWPRLSDCEKDVARSILMGHSNKEIGYELRLSPSRTTNLVRSAIQKLGLGSRAELSAAFRAIASSSVAGDPGGC